MSEPIRVAMIIHGYPPRVGGAEQQLAAFAPLLQAQGADVHVLTRRFRGLAPFERIEGIPVHRLPVPGPKAVASVSFTINGLRLLWQLRPHILHAHELFSAATTALLAKRFLAAPVVVTAHRSGELGDVQKLGRKRTGARRLASLRRQVDAFVCISHEIDRELAAVGIPHQRRHFIPNGVDTECFAPVSARRKRELRAALGLPDVPITVFAGRLAREKRISHLVAIWPAVRARHPGALLCLLGSGPEEEAIRQEASEGVRLVGPVADVAPYLQAADLFVLPSIAEGLSVALLEALSTGLPAIVTKVGGARDVVEHGENGWLVPPDDVPALQEAVLTLLGDADRRADLGRRGRERVVRDFALPALAERVIALYQQLTLSRRAEAGCQGASVALPKTIARDSKGTNP